VVLKDHLERLKSHTTGFGGGQTALEVRISDIAIHLLFAI
jgi:hypothetical protein